MKHSQVTNTIRPFDTRDYNQTMVEAIIRQLLDLARSGVISDPITYADSLQSAQSKIQRFLQSRDRAELPIHLTSSLLQQTLKKYMPTEIKDPGDEKILMAELNAIAASGATSEMPLSQEHRDQLNAITAACDAANRTIAYSADRGWYTEPKKA